MDREDSQMKKDSHAQKEELESPSVAEGGASASGAKEAEGGASASGAKEAEGGASASGAKEAEGGASASAAKEAEGGASSSTTTIDDNIISDRLASKMGYNPLMPDVDVLHYFISKEFFEDKIRFVNVKFSRKLLFSVGYTIRNKQTGKYDMFLSYPILRLRPLSELVQVMLHEAIHVYVGVYDYKGRQDEHGSSFQMHMNRINAIAGTDINIIHNFEDNDQNRNIRYMRCNGPCNAWPPYFGVVRYSSKVPEDLTEDYEHKEKCGGTFVKEKQGREYKEKHETGEVACFICKEMISRTLITDHFDVCIPNTIATSESDFVHPDNDKNVTILNGKTVSVEDLPDSKTIYPCPHCQAEYDLEEMLKHLDSIFDQTP